MAKVRTEKSAGAFKRLAIRFCVIAAGAGALAAIIGVLAGIYARDAGIKREILRDWENAAYAEAFAKCAGALEKHPLDHFLLTLNGFVSYQLAVSQINAADTLVYLDRCIWSLRKALLKKNADRDGRIRYVLGKAYFEKGRDYADLAIRYLEEAEAAGYRAYDISEYLGLAYEAVREYRKSVEVLSRSLDPNKNGEDSDRLLLAIALSYTGLEDWENARAYLARCIEQTRDTEKALTARLMLGKVVKNSGDISGAEKIFDEVLETVESAEASYELGEIYAAQGDAVRSRAAWRRAYRADANYKPARVRLNML
jgi:tetratricopeptide (TPR) repeat protein